jgi:poly(A) polymerase
MVEPRTVQRAEHPLSRRDMDPDAVKVLYRLREAGYIAYLVGGSVRDLLLGRHPKDFDIGTSAHPNQVKKLFRNCWIIGRRFRLAHVKFGTKVIEVATFRRQVEAPGEIVEPVEMVEGADGAADSTPSPDTGAPDDQLLVHHDNTFGTPEEDAFRRDFTINALFYDIATFSIIDYVGGLDDLRAGVVRAIGDPDVRMREDPVRMMRAVSFASRLNFRVDEPVLDAIRTHRHEISKSAPPRLLEEYYKILRSGSGERTFRDLAGVGLIEPISGELHQAAAGGAAGAAALWQSLAAVDRYRQQFESAPATLTNPVLLGSLLVPLGISLGRPEEKQLPRLGSLPLARRDVERLRQIMSMQRRLREVTAPARVQRALTHRHIFVDALTWFEIHGDSPDIVEHWETLLSEEPPVSGDGSQPVEPPETGGHMPGRRRRRRRRRHHAA